MEAPGPQLIRASATELQDGVAVDDTRAAELAVEVGRLNATVLGMRGIVRFEDEPAHFACALEDAAR